MSIPYPCVVLVQGAPPESTDGDYDMQFLSSKDAKGNWCYSHKQKDAHVFQDLDMAATAIRDYRNTYGEHRQLFAVRGEEVEWSREKRRRFLQVWQVEK